MNVLLTGAFGNIGSAALEELLLRGHRVRCFDVRTKANEKTARRFHRRAEVLWGDLRNPPDVEAAVAGQDVVVHLAFVIPTLSVTGVNCEERPDWARAINVGGTANLLAALRAHNPGARLLFASSLHVYGRTQDQPPPRTVDELPHPVEHYAHHKVECEQMVQQSGLRWAIFRFGAALPQRMILDPGMFGVPLENRIEFVHRQDVALAIANALETDAVWGRVWLIGGGQRCQLIYREMMHKVLDAVGVGPLPDEAFTTTPFSTDWLDTRESQRVLLFQRHTLDDYARELAAMLGVRRWLARLFRPLVRRWLLSFSPYLKQAPAPLTPPSQMKIAP